MRRLLLTLVALAALAPAAVAQLTASAAFTSAPASVLPLLSRNARLDMIDYYNSGSTTPTKNVMQGLSRLTALSPMSLSATLTVSSECQIALLPMRGDTAILVIETVLTPIPDSRLTIYDRQWQPLARQPFVHPSTADWLTKEGKKAAEPADMLPFVLASAAYSPEEQTLTLTQQMAGYFTPDDYARLSPYLHSTLAYRWDSRRFTPVK